MERVGKRTTPTKLASFSIAYLRLCCGQLGVFHVRSVLLDQDRALELALASFICIECNGGESRCDCCE